MKLSRMLVFSPFRLDPGSQQLWRDSELVPLRPKAFAVLNYLAEHAGELVTQSQLFQAVWPDVTVSDELLRGYIHELRKVLGDNASAPRFIETASRRGYRFLAQVTTTPARRATDEQLAPLSGARSGSNLLVGRETDLAALNDCLASASDGERQVIFVTGEPGIGKTALVEAFLEDVGTRHPALIASGQCVEHYGAGEAYLPLLQALGSLCRAGNGKPVVDALDRYAPTWLVQISGIVTGAQFEDLRRRVQGTTQARMLRELAEALEAISADQLVVVALEDLHWSDHSTLELISMVARRRQPARLMLLGTFRPADAIIAAHPLRAVTRELKAHGLCKELPLRHLVQADVARHLAARFPAHRFPQDLARVIHRDTDGNPLFVATFLEELLSRRMVRRVDNAWQLDAAIDKVAALMPDNLRQLIRGQIARLSAAEQRVLQASSVAGAEFNSAAVAAALNADVAEIEACCDGLAEREQFLRATGIAEWPDGTSASRYAFVHALYQHGALEHTALRHQQDWHRRIAERMEAGYGVRALEVASELAMHFERARDYRRAIHYYALAGETAKRTSAHFEAMAQTVHALGLVQNLPLDEQASAELDLRLQLGPIVMTRSGFASREGEEVYLQARDLAERTAAGPTRRFGILWGLWLSRAMRGEWEEARMLGDELLETARQSDEPALLLQAHHALGNTFVYAGEPLRGREHARKCADLYRPEVHHDLSFIYGAHDPAVCSMVHEAAAHWLLGYPQKALEVTEEAVALARKLNHPHSIVIALVYSFMVHQLRRETIRAADYADAVIKLSTEYDFRQWLMMGEFFKIWCSCERQPRADDLARMRGIIEHYRLSRANRGRPWFLALFAERSAAIAPEAGLEALAEAAEGVKTGERWYEPELQRLRGELLLLRRRPRLSEAERCYRTAIEAARSQAARSWELRAAASLARLLDAHGRKAEARAELRPIYGWFGEGHDTADLCEAKSLLGSRKPLSRRLV